MIVLGDFYSGSLRGETRHDSARDDNSPQAYNQLHVALRPLRPEGGSLVDVGFEAVHRKRNNDGCYKNNDGAYQFCSEPENNVANRRDTVGGSHDHRQQHQYYKEPLTRSVPFPNQLIIYWRSICLLLLKRVHEK